MTITKNIQVKNLFLFGILIITINSQSSLTTSSQMTIKLQNNGPLYANPGVLIDFLIDPPVVRTQQQVEDLFTL